MARSVIKTGSSFHSAGRYTADEPARIAVKTWAPAGVGPDQPPVAILQLNHGMSEHINRYDRFARKAAERGWLVVGMDFLGHGDSVDERRQLGFSGPPLPGGRNVFLEDMHRLRVRTQAQWPDIPYFMFGHSMGSFVLRAYLEEHSDGLSGAIICGTAAMSPLMVTFGKGLLTALGTVYPPEHRSRLFAVMSIGPYNKPFEKKGRARTQFEWLSGDDRQVTGYMSDPSCGFMFTLSCDRLLMDSLARANAPAAYRHVNKDLPLLLLSGGADPVGGMGKGVRKVARAYQRANVHDVTLHIYPGDRHELLNERNRGQVTSDILTWIDAHLDTAT
ncbi:MAG: alpha/beta hydrolase [Propionibacteriaceae bacterium]|nr:alpha/beta hydrolase [Propionibacteriaceae bacterium]